MTEKRCEYSYTKTKCNQRRAFQHEWLLLCDVVASIPYYTIMKRYMMGLSAAC